VSRGALVLVGHGRYQDLWHDDVATAQRVVSVLEELDLTPRLRGTFRGTLDAERPDDLALVVVLAGRGRVDPEFDGTDDEWRGFHTALAALVDAGVPLLALHQAANTFTDSPRWSGLVGGRWVPDTSMHPPIGDATFDVVDDGHPVTSGLGAVRAFDERYCHLDVDPGSRVLLTTRHEDRDHPVVWVAPGPGRVLYDGLGHDLRSYDSPERADLLRREVAWLLAPAGGHGG
jgi:uncharacterized protein